MCSSVLTKERDSIKICVGLCVASDLKVTDGARHSFSGHKPFTQEALLTRFVLMRSTKRRSHYHSLISLTWLSQLYTHVSLFPACLSHTWSTTITPPALLTNILFCFHKDKHTYFVACSCSSWFPVWQAHMFSGIQHTGCVVASCKWRVCWQMWR